MNKMDNKPFLYRKERSLGFVIQCTKCNQSLFVGDIIGWKLEYRANKDKYVPIEPYCEKCFEKINE